MQSPRIIYQNILILLSDGQFPGSAAPAIAEAQEAIRHILQEIIKREDEAGSQQSGSVVGDAQGADRVVGGEVPDPKRKGRRGRSKPA